MRVKIELNAKCRNCVHWHFETEDGMDFLEDDETFCKLDNKKRKPQDECNSLELDIFNLKSNLASAGFERVKIEL